MIFMAKNRPTMAKISEAHVHFCPLNRFFKNHWETFVETHWRNITTTFGTLTMHGFLKKCS